MIRIQKPRVCEVAGCGRPLRARGLCQTHYKHLRKLGKVRPIKPKRAGRAGTVRYSGLSLTERCAAALQVLAKQRSVAPNAVITDILESWARRRA